MDKGGFLYHNPVNSDAVPTASTTAPDAAEIRGDCYARLTVAEEPAHRSI